MREAVLYRGGVGSIITVAAVLEQTRSGDFTVLSAMGAPLEPLKILGINFPQIKLMRSVTRRSTLGLHSQVKTALDHLTWDEPTVLHTGADKNFCYRSPTRISDSLEDEEVFLRGTGRDVSLCALIASFEPSRVLSTLALRLDNTFDMMKAIGLTTSCYNSDAHCSQCQGCIDREYSFYDAGITDPRM